MCSLGVSTACVQPEHTHCVQLGCVYCHVCSLGALTVCSLSVSTACVQPGGTHCVQLGGTHCVQPESSLHVCSLSTLTVCSLGVSTACVQPGGTHCVQLGCVYCMCAAWGHSLCAAWVSLLLHAAGGHSLGGAPAALDCVCGLGALDAQVKCESILK